MLVALVFACVASIVSGMMHNVAFATHLRPSITSDRKQAVRRDLSKIPLGTNYGHGVDKVNNMELESRRLDFLERELYNVLTTAKSMKQRPIFTTALIAGDCVLLDALHKTGLLDTTPVIFVDTFTLFPETLQFLKEVEQYYGFKAKVYHAEDCKNQVEYYEKYGHDFWKIDIDRYDCLCKVEPMNRALKEHASDCWINGRRRDHGAERASLPVWEDKKLNPLAMWTFEDCWSYIRRHSVPYHPLHEQGYASLGDVHSTLPVDHKNWFTYGGERSGRFQNLVNKDGTTKTECGIHNKITL